MRDRSFSSSTFPAARCDACGTTVLTHLALGASGEIGRRCLRCDMPIEAEVTWLSSAELAEAGYQVGSPKPADARGCGGACGCATRAN